MIATVPRAASRIFLSLLLVGSMFAGPGCSDAETTPSEAVDATTPPQDAQSDSLSASETGKDGSAATDGGSDGSAADSGPDSPIAQDAGPDAVASDSGSDAVEVPDGAVEADAPETGADAQAPLSWGVCDTTDWPDGYPKPSQEVECTAVEVPLDHAQPSGPSISLRVARHKSKVFPNGKAVFQLAGGPGGTSVGQAGIIPYFMPHLRDTFDLIYIDQRGTGGSGYMDCSAGYPQTKQEWVACAAEYAGQDLQHYLTIDAAHDMNVVRQRLGYDKIYLRGGSYGTRLGLEYLRQHGDTVVAAVLDGLAPPNFDHFDELIRNIDLSINRLVDDCTASAGCLAISPSLGSDLVHRRTSLKASPRPILVGGQMYQEDEWMFVDALIYTVWDSYWRFRVPHAVHAATTGDNTLWNGILSELYGVTITDPPKSAGDLPKRTARLPKQRREWRGQSYVAPALYMTVVCAEWFPNTTTDLHTLAAAQTWGNEDDQYAPPAMAEACGAWGVTPIDAALRERVQSDVRVMLLSGDIDFNTTQAWGDDAVQTLSNGTHLVIPYATHSTMSVPCAAGMITSFLGADGDISQVDSGCIQQIVEPAWP